MSAKIAALQSPCNMHLLVGLHFLDRPFPSKILDNTYLKALGTGKKISLRKILIKYADKALYVDFWASWCGACIDDIHNSYKAKKFLKAKNIVYLYISLDTELNASKWEKASDKNNIMQNQYLLDNDFSSPLVKFLKIDYIPRYLILNGDHQLKDIYAPRPIESQLPNFKSAISGATMKIYHF